MHEVEASFYRRPQRGRFRRPAIGRLVDGGAAEWPGSDSVYQKYREFRDIGIEWRALVDAFLTDDWAAPPTSVRIVGTLQDGAEVDETIHCETHRRKA